MPECSGHVTPDDADCKSCCEHGQRMCRPDMDEPDQADMQPRHDAAALIRPVPGAPDVQDDQEDSRCNGEMMPGCNPCIGNRPDNSTKQDARRPDVTAPQKQVHHLRPGGTLLIIRSAFIIVIHALRHALPARISDFVRSRGNKPRSSAPDLTIPIRYITTPARTFVQ